ncbi:MAG: hypothetical protein KGI60_03465 [Patescibacteria group bacterium]|nr:hypothetical protein [Patescibacteria group bacterium]
MSLLLEMVSNNVPLHTWRKFAAENSSRSQYGGWCSKKLDDVARIIVNGCANGEVVDLVAREWDNLDSQYRMAITREANMALGTRSNNKTKGIRRLDERLGGRVLTTVDSRPTQRRMEVVGGRLRATNRPIDPARAGASRAYAIISLPANYADLPPAQKRKIQQELAKRRREAGE